MSEILKFGVDSPVLAFFLLCSIYYLLRYSIVRGCRTINIAIRGWPPSHLDADGDWKPEPERVELERVK